MERLLAAIAELESFPEAVDPRELSAAIDRLQALQCLSVRDGVGRGDHLVAGATPCGWVADVCRLSGSSAADRLCVAEQLEKMPRLAQAVRSGEIGYQASSVICHLGEL
ncbi:MAG TPA: DUF222 domain-containing protein, partial [Steroidobacteraceae bacterium]|nr:DUF222 domain-containing protein [Steroidobacteraceae bacterium]